MTGRRGALGAALLLVMVAGSGQAQVQVRLDDGVRGTYSELHDGLQPGTPAADSVRRIVTETRPLVLWRRVRAALRDRAPWNDAVLALTRLAELPRSAVTDSAARLARIIEAGRQEAPPARDAADLLEPLRAVALGAELRRAGAPALQRRLLALADSGRYGLAEAWWLGRLGVGDSLAARFLAARTEQDRVRWLTLMSFATDTTLVPLLGRIYAAPDSFSVPRRAGSRALDGLAWIGTAAARAELVRAWGVAKARGVYADPALARGGFGAVENDSGMVWGRTGRW